MPPVAVASLRGATSAAAVRCRCLAHPTARRRPPARLAQHAGGGAAGRRAAFPPAALRTEQEEATAASTSSPADATPAPPPTSAWPPPPPATPPPIDVDIETAPGQSNARRLYASTDIAAPAFVVWNALTAYDKLGDFVPGLAENRCLARTAGGCTLLQVGQQSLALGLSFRARVVLDIQEHPSGLPASLWTGGGGGGGGAPLGEAPAQPAAGSASGGWEDLYPQPRSRLPPSTPTRDISFAQVEGDFVAFRGVWRMQELRGEGGDDPDAPPPPPGPRTRLSYALYVRPAPWLPVHLVARRVAGEVAANLGAVRAHTEKTWRGE